MIEGTQKGAPCRHEKESSMNMRLSITVLATALALVLGAGVAPARAHADDPATGDPVVLAGGAFLGENANRVLADRLRDAGFDVYVYVIPTPLAPLQTTAPSLARFVAEVQARTGADKVDIVNHSQSGLLTRHFIKYLGGADDVDAVVSLSGLHQGSRLGNLAKLLTLDSCVGVVLCRQLAEGSDYLEALNNPVQAIGDIHYLNIGSRADVLAIPPSNNFMFGPGDITNVLVQDQCQFRLPGHIGMIYDGAVASAVIQGLREEPIRFDCFAA